VADPILVTVAERIMEIRINRPEKRNALTAAMYAAMAEAIERAARDGQVRAVLIVGSDGHFTAGNDLRDFQQNPPRDPEAPVFRFLRAITTFPKVLIAGVVGSAIGIGTTMLLHCDLVVAGRGARFAMPFVDLGLVPEAGSSLLLPALIGRRRAAKHLLLGEPFGADVALDYGIASEVVDDGAVEETARSLALRIAAKAPQAVMLSKKLMLGNSAVVLERIAEEAALFADRLQSPEVAEAIAAFYEKRAPRFE
jgi:enoyl-CoA hydratase/carnithine racemase